ncbi:MAG: TldD/PmbA family protein, partial [Oscillospiraceae bacterium]|nr:TldD/PmbA family protein [Oscillospiraceae bacterium]
GFAPLPTPLPADEPAVLKKETACIIHPRQLGDEAIVNRLTALRQKALAYDGRVLDAQASVSYRSYRKLFLSENRDLDQTVMWTTASVVAMASRGQEIKIGYRPFSVLGGAEVLDGMDAGVEAVCHDALELLDSQPIQPGEYECVCSPETTGMIVHEAFGHGVEMDMFVKDRAQAREFIGQYVASPLVTMHDGSAVEQTATAFFDDEGTLTGDTVVIDKGVLKTGMCDALSAARLGVKPTGNGRRESYERKAYTRMTNTYFQGGDATPEEMIASVKDGFLLEAPSSGMEDPKNWGIQCMVTTAREIKDGKLTGKIFSPIVLTGYVPDLLKSVTMMSKTVELSGSGFCGKGYKEWVKVSDGGPYMKARIRLG